MGDALKFSAVAENLVRGGRQSLYITRQRLRYVHSNQDCPRFWCMATSRLTVSRTFQCIYLQIEMCGHNPCESTRANNHRTCGNSWLAKIKSNHFAIQSTTILNNYLLESTSQWWSHNHWNDKMAGDLSIFERIINACSQNDRTIGIRNNMWWLLSSNVSSHMSNYMSSHLGLRSGGQLLG